MQSNNRANPSGRATGNLGQNINPLQRLLSQSYRQQSEQPMNYRQTPQQSQNYRSQPQRLPVASVQQVGVNVVGDSGSNTIPAVHAIPGSNPIPNAVPIIAPPGSIPLSSISTLVGGLPILQVDQMLAMGIGLGRDGINLNSLTNAIVLDPQHLSQQLQPSLLESMRSILNPLQSLASVSGSGPPRFINLNDLIGWSSESRSQQPLVQNLHRQGLAQAPADLADDSKSEQAGQGHSLKPSTDVIDLTEKDGGDDHTLGSESGRALKINVEGTTDDIATKPLKVNRKRKIQETAHGDVDHKRKQVLEDSIHLNVHNHSLLIPLDHGTKPAGPDPNVKVLESNNPGDGTASLHHQSTYDEKADGSVAKLNHPDSRMKGKHRKAILYVSSDEDIRAIVDVFLGKAAFTPGKYTETSICLIPSTLAKISTQLRIAFENVKPIPRIKSKVADRSVPMSDEPDVETESSIENDTKSKVVAELDRKLKLQQELIAINKKFIHRLRKNLDTAYPALNKKQSVDLECLRQQLASLCQSRQSEIPLDVDNPSLEFNTNTSGQMDGKALASEMRNVLSKLNDELEFERKRGSDCIRSYVIASNHTLKLMQMTDDYTEGV